MIFDYLYYFCAALINPYMRHTLIILITLLSYTIASGQESQSDVVTSDLDSLLEVSKNQLGLDKVRTYVMISKKYTLQSFDKAQQYALDAMYECEQLVNNLDDVENKDIVYYEYTKAAVQAGNTYYLIASKSANQEIHASACEKSFGFTRRAEWSFAQIKDTTNIPNYETEFPTLITQSYVTSYLCKGDIDSALYYVDKSIAFAKEKHLNIFIANYTQNKAMLLFQKGWTTEALKTLEELNVVLEGDTSPRSVQLLTVNYENLAAIYVNSGQYEKGEKYIKKALELAVPLKNTAVICYCYGGLSEIAEARGDYKSALELNKIFYAYQDTLYNKEKADQISALEVKYNTAQKEMEISKLENQKTMTKILVAILVAIIILVVIISRIRRRAYKLLRDKNLQIEAHKNEIVAQRDELNAMLVELSDNISYASLLQNRIMIGDRRVDEVLSKAFVIYSPKDVVGGDFFYVKQCGDYKIITVADCTGHGVSAAMLTIMNISFLNEYFAAAPTDTSEDSFDPYFDPAHILEKLRSNVKTTLNAQENETIAMSGMDMALMIHKSGDTKVKFAGANRPLYVVRDDQELIEIRPVRNPIASYVKEREFETTDFEYKESDMFYMFSDGFTDQFSADGSTKLKTKGLKDILVKYAKKAEVEQKKLIMEEFNKFRGMTEQLDDTILVGVRGSSL